MGHTVNVNSPASVMARENGLKSDNTAVVARLNTTEERGVEVAVIVRITVTVRDDTRVNTLEHVEVSHRSSMING